MILPTYNERATIGAVLDGLTATGAELDILVVDDGSPDGTGAIVRERSDADPHIRLVERPRKSGLASAQSDRVDPAGTRCGAVESAAVRLRRGGAGGDPVRPARRPGPPAGARGRGAGAGGQGLLLADRGARSRPACTRPIVEIDPETWRDRHPPVLRRARLRDRDQPDDRRGQVHGGVAQGIGGALYETLAYDEHGQLLNASFMDFLMPYVTEVPERIEIGHQETPSPLNPLGIKGAGRGGRDPGVGGDRVGRSRTRSGFRIDAMPISPEPAVRRCSAEHAAGPDPDHGGRPAARGSAHAADHRENPMKINGSAVLHAPPERVWAAVTDPAVLAAVIPGCDVADADRGEPVRAHGEPRRRLDQGQLFGRGVVRRSASSRSRSPCAPRDPAVPGTIDTTVAVTLDEHPDGTELDYEADAMVGGMVGGVGQRVLAGVAKKTAGLFFSAIDAQITGGRRRLPAAALPAATAIAARRRSCRRGREPAAPPLRRSRPAGRRASWSPSPPPSGRPPHWWACWSARGSGVAARADAAAPAAGRRGTAVRRVAARRTRTPVRRSPIAPGPDGSRASRRGRSRPGSRTPTTRPAPAPPRCRPAGGPGTARR